MSTQKSTIVRIKTTAIRSTFATLERLAPALGARWVAHLWLRVPEYRGRPRPDVIPPGDPFTVEVDGREVRGRTWGSGPAVYLVHGWGGVSSQLRDYLEPLLQKGFRVIAYDAPSHGTSDPGRFGPRHTSIPEMSTALRAVVDAHGPAHAIVAHSLGCNAVFHALRRGLRVERLVFLAPMTQPIPYTAIFAAMMGFDHRIRTRMIDLVARRTGEPWSAFDIPSQVATITPPPLLTLHDPNDRETRYADSVELTRTWPNATLHRVRNLGHWRILRDPETLSRAVAFLSPTAAPNQAAAS